MGTLPSCSISNPNDCNCYNDGRVPYLQDTIQWCIDHKDCCYYIGKDYAKYGYDYKSTNCYMVNNTMTKLSPDTCTPDCSEFHPESCPDPSALDTTPLNWRHPITSGSKCFTTVPKEEGLVYTNHSQSLGDEFVCMNYISWFEPLKKYVYVATTGDTSLHSSMSLYPSIYMNLTKCSTDYCNNPANLVGSLDTFQPEITFQTGPGLDCFKGIYPNVSSKFIYKAESCVRYSFVADYKSGLVTVYDGLPASDLPTLNTTFYIKNATSCSTPNCNTIIVPPTETSAPVWDANNSGKLVCFESIDSGNIVVMHPNPSPDPSTKYCIRLKSTIDNSTIFFSAQSYSAYTSFSKATNVFVCNTNLCNAPQTSSSTLKCHLTTPNNVSTVIKYDLSLPVDYCVKYVTDSESKFYSAVTSDQLAIINANPTKFKEVVSCQTDYCVAP